jgi:putative transposase
MPCGPTESAQRIPSPSIRHPYRIIGFGDPRHRFWFPDWPLERSKEPERPLSTVIATCYLLGVSTRWIDPLVETFGITSLSNSQVSLMIAALDTAVEALGSMRPRCQPAHFVAGESVCP